MAHARIVGLLGLVTMVGLAAACTPPASSTVTPESPAPTTAAPAPVTSAPTTTLADVVPAPTTTQPAAVKAPLASVDYVKAPLTDATDLPDDFTGWAEIQFNSPDDDDDADNDLVYGVVYVPATRSVAKSCIALVHGYSDRRSTYWLVEYAQALQAQGHVVIAADQRNHGDRSTPGPYGGVNKANSPAGMADIVSDSARDVRRSFDWLETEVGCEKYGVVGHSMGGWIATIVAGADARIDGLVTLASGGNFDALLRKSGHDVFVGMSGRPLFLADFGVNETLVKQALVSLDPVDAARWMSERVTVPALTMWHSTDPIIPSASFSALAAAAEANGGRRLTTGGVQYHLVNGWNSPGGDLYETKAYMAERLAS